MAAWRGHSSGKLAAPGLGVKSNLLLQLMPAAVGKAPPRRPERGLAFPLLLLLLFLLPVVATDGSTSTVGRHQQKLRDGGTAVLEGAAKQLLPTVDQLNNGAASEQLASIAALHSHRPANEASTYLAGPAASLPLNAADKLAYYFASQEAAPEVAGELEEQEEGEEEDEEDQDDYNDYGAYIIYDTASSSPGASSAASSDAGAQTVMQSATGDRRLLEGSKPGRPAALIFFAATPAPRHPQAEWGPRTPEQVAAKMDHSSNQSAFKAASLSQEQQQVSVSAATGSPIEPLVAGKAHQMRRQDQSSGGNSTEIKESSPSASRRAGEEVASRAGRARRHQASLVLVPTQSSSTEAPAQAQTLAGPANQWPLEAPLTPGPTAGAHIKWLSKMNGRPGADHRPPQSSGKQTANSIDNDDKGDYIEAQEHMLATTVGHQQAPKPKSSTVAFPNQAGASSIVGSAGTPNLSEPAWWDASSTAAANHVSTILTRPTLLVGGAPASNWISNREPLIGGPKHVTRLVAPQAAALSLGEPPTSNVPKHNVYYWRLIWFILPLGATFGNLLVIIAVYLERSLQSVTNYFIVSLAFADLFVGLIVMPFAVYVLVNEVWELSDTICDIFVAVDVTSSTASILNLVAISIDRYRAVAYPIAYTTGSSSTIAVLTICGVWLISSAVGTPIIFGLNTTPGRRSDLCILYNSTFIFWSSLASFYIPCIIMIALYWRVFSAIRSRTKKALQASEYKVAAVAGANQQHRKQAASIEHQPQLQAGAAKMLITSPPGRQQNPHMATNKQLPSHASGAQKSPTNHTGTPVSKTAPSNPQSAQHKSHQPPPPSSTTKSPLASSKDDGSKCSLRRILCSHTGCEQQLRLLRSRESSPLDSSCWQLALELVAACECSNIDHQPSPVANSCIKDFISRLARTRGLGARQLNTDSLDSNQQLSHIIALMGALWRMPERSLHTTSQQSLPLLKANSSSLTRTADGVLSVSLEYNEDQMEATVPEVDPPNTSEIPSESRNKKNRKLLEEVAIAWGSHVKVLLSEQCQFASSTSSSPGLPPSSSPPTQQSHQQQILCPCCRRASAPPQVAPQPPSATMYCLLEPPQAAPLSGNEQLPLKLNKITLLSSNGATTKQPLMMIAYARLHLELKQDTSLMICIHRWPATSPIQSKQQEPRGETFKCRLALGSQLCGTCLASCSLSSLLVLSDATADCELGSGPPISDESPLKESVVAVEECVHLARLLKVERATPRRSQHLSEHAKRPTRGDLELSNSDHEEVSSEEEVDCAGRDALSVVSSNSSALASSLSHSSSSSTNFRFGSDFFSGSSTNQPNCHVHHGAGQMISSDCCPGSPPHQAPSRGELQSAVLCASCSSQQQHESQLAPPGDHQFGCWHCEHPEMMASLPEESDERRQKARFEPPTTTTHRKSSSTLSGRRATGGELLIASTGKREEHTSKLVVNQQQAANLLQNATQTIKRRSMRLSQLIRSGKRGRGKQETTNNKEQVDTSNSTPEATNSEAEDVYSSSLTPFGSSALAGKSATLNLSSQYTSTTPTTTIVAAVSAPDDGASPPLPLPPQLVLEQMECSDKQLESLIVASQLTADKQNPAKNDENKDEYNNKTSLTQVVVASSQRIAMDDHPQQQQQQQHKFNASNQITQLDEAAQKKNKSNPPARKQPSQRHRVAGSKRRREKNAAKRERKATKTLAIVLGIFLICWTPFFTCNIIDGVCIQLNMDCRPGMMVYTITSWLGYINSCVNPIIYTIFNMEFRRAFKKIICIRSKK